MTKQEFSDFCDGLERGEIRVAEKISDEWVVNVEV